MDANHPKNKDQQPKRRKDKYNPYSIFSVGIDTDEPHFYISFTDVQKLEHCIEISEEMYWIFDRFELDDVVFLNEVDRHYERSEQTEEQIANREAVSPASVEEEALRDIQNELLYKEIAELPDTQRRRLMLYYFGDMTYAEIAVKEGCTKMPVKRSIDAAIKKLQEKIKKF